MRFTPLVTLIAAAIAASFYLPWFPAGVGQVFAHPSELLGAMTKAEGQPGYSLLLSFLFTYVLAGFLAVTSLFGLAPRALALLTAAGPLVLAGVTGAKAVRSGASYGLPLPAGGDWLALTNAVVPLMQIGAWLYLGGAVLLLLLALADPGMRQRR